MEFEWNPSKDAANLVKHGISFAGAARAFDGQMLVRPSDRSAESRWIGVGRIGTHVVAIVFTRRGAVVRLISARKARKYEKAAHLSAFPEGPS